jgi:hypothetical protein
MRRIILAAAVRVAPAFRQTNALGTSKTQEEVGDRFTREAWPAVLAPIGIVVPVVVVRAP